MGKKIFLAFSFLILSAASLYCFWVVTAYALAPSNDYVGVAQNGFSEPFLSEYYKNPQGDEAVSSSKASSVGEVTVAANNVAKGKIINTSIDSSNNTASSKDIGTNTSLPFSIVFRKIITISPFP